MPDIILKPLHVHSSSIDIEKSAKFDISSFAHLAKAVQLHAAKPTQPTLRMRYELSEKKCVEIKNSLLKVISLMGELFTLSDLVVDDVREQIRSLLQGILEKQEYINNFNLSYVNASSKCSTDLLNDYHTHHLLYELVRLIKANLLLTLGDYKDAIKEFNWLSDSKRLIHSFFQDRSKIKELLGEEWLSLNIKEFENLIHASKFTAYLEGLLSHQVRAAEVFTLATEFQGNYLNIMREKFSDRELTDKEVEVAVNCYHKLAMETRNNEELLEVGAELVNLNKPEEADKVFVDIISKLDKHSAAGAGESIKVYHTAIINHIITLIARKQYAEAESNLAKISKDSSKEVAFLKCFIFHKLDKFKEALTIFSSSLIDFDVDTEKGKLFKAIYFYKMSEEIFNIDPTKSSEYIRMALEKVPTLYSPAPEEEDCDIDFILGLKALSGKNYSDSLNKFNEAIIYRQEHPMQQTILLSSAESRAVRVILGQAIGKNNFVLIKQILDLYPALDVTDAKYNLRSPFEQITGRADEILLRIFFEKIKEKDSLLKIKSKEGITLLENLFKYSSSDDIYYIMNICKELKVIPFKPSTSINISNETIDSLAHSGIDETNLEHLLEDLGVSKEKIIKTLGSLSLTEEVL